MPEQGTATCMHNLRKSKVAGLAGEAVLMYLASITVSLCGCVRTSHLPQNPDQRWGCTHASSAPSSFREHSPTQSFQDLTIAWKSLF